MKDLRQLPEWGNYLSSIGWNIEKIGSIQIFIRKIPLINRAIIKIQHPQNPLNFSKINQLAKKHHALFVLIEPEIYQFDESLFIKNGYQKSPMTLTHTATIHLDLTQPEQQMMTNFSENARRNIKKALTNNLEVKVLFLNKEKDDVEFRKFYTLLNNLTKIKKFYTPGYEEFHKKMMAFKKNSILFFAYKNSEPIATIWASYTQDKIAYMHTGITDDGYKYMANYLLVWEMIKAGQKLKLKTFDFEGIYDPRFPQERKKWINFSEFKKRFHGDLVFYPQPRIKFYSLTFKLFFLCNQILSR